MIWRTAWFYVSLVIRIRQRPTRGLLQSQSEFSADMWEQPFGVVKYPEAGAQGSADVWMEQSKDGRNKMDGLARLIEAFGPLCVGWCFGEFLFWTAQQIASLIH